MEEKQAPCREPDAGLDPRTSGSHPEPKANTQPLSHSGIPLFSFLPFFFFLRFYSFIHERYTEREGEKERQRHRQREKQAPRREPDMGLDPRSPGSRPGLKAVLNR